MNLTDATIVLLRPAAGALALGARTERRARHAVARSAGEAAIGLLESALASPLTEQAVDRVLDSPLIERALTRALRGPLVDAVARDVPQLADRLLAAGIADEIATRLLDGPELERIVAAVLESPSATRLGDNVIDSPLVERALTRALRGPLVDAVARDVPQLADRLLAGGIADEIATRLLDGPELERIVAAVLESPSAARLGDSVLDSPQAERLVARVIESRLLDEAVARLLESKDLWLLVDEVARSPSVTEAISHQSVGFAEEIAGGVRDRSRRADDRVERIARRLFRREAADGHDT